MTLTRDLRHELDRADVDYDLIEHRRTETAGDEAKAIGVPPEQVAKTIVLARGTVTFAPSCPVRAPRPPQGAGTARRQPCAARERSRARHGVPDVRAGRGAAVRRPAGDRVLFERRLAEQDSVVLEAGSHNESLRMKTPEFLTLSGAEVADIAAKGSAKTT